MESACLRDAAAIVSLTHAAATYLQERHNEEIGSKPLVIIPTCADLDRFSPSSTSARARSIHGCIGTITSGWFRIDWLAAWFAAVAADDSEALFEIVTRDDPARVRAAVDPKGCIGERLAVFARRPAEMPETVRAHKTSAMFYAGGEISEIGRSPTRMAEVLGSGIPVIANGGIGDVEKILREHRVGVIVSDSGDDAMVAALKELQELQRDPELASRCRTAAAEIFSLDRGTQIYRDLYRVIVEFGVAKSL
jgi:glycosyltransferase involved in cell wall biosynthesis